MRFVSSEPLSHCSSFFIFLFPDITIANVSRMKKNLSLQQGDRLLFLIKFIFSLDLRRCALALTVPEAAFVIAAARATLLSISSPIVCAFVFVRTMSACYARGGLKFGRIFPVKFSLSIGTARTANLPVCSPDNRFRICTRIRAAMQCCKCSSQTFVGKRQWTFEHAGQPNTVDSVPALIYTTSSVISLRNIFTHVSINMISIFLGRKINRDWWAFSETRRSFQSLRCF